MNYYNPYYQPYMQGRPIEQNFQPQQNFQQSYPQNPQNYPQPQQSSLQGKVVESIDVIKATEIPFDGSTSYFALADGSAIITKQLQNDGTIKMVTFKPSTDKAPETPKYVTEERLNELLSKEDTTNYEEEIKGLKRQIRDLQEDIKEMQKTKSRKSDD